MPDEENYSIYGKIIDRESEQGIPNLTVKAFDKDPIFDDVLGSSKTVEDGSFRILYDEKDFTERFLDKRPDIYLKIFDSAGNLRHTTKDHIRFQADMSEEFIVRISSDRIIRGPRDDVFRIRGILTNTVTREPLAGYKIQAYDKDLFFDDKLGDAISGEDGKFLITFEAKDFQEYFLDRDPDIYLKFYHPDGEQLYTTENDPSIPPDDEEELSFDLTIWKKIIRDWWIERRRIDQLNGDDMPYPYNFHSFLRCEEIPENPLHTQIAGIPKFQEGAIFFNVRNDGNCPAYTCCVEIYEGSKKDSQKFSEYRFRDRIIISLQPQQTKKVTLEKWKRDQTSGYFIGTCFDPILDPRKSDEFQTGDRNLVFTSFTVRGD